MSGIQNHIAALRARHNELDRKIKAKELRPLWDPLELRRLKSKKLLIKDKIARLEAVTSSLAAVT